MFRLSVVVVGLGQLLCHLIVTVQGDELIDSREQLTDETSQPNDFFGGVHGRNIFGFGC